MESAGKALGHIIALHVNVFNPSAIVVGGGCLRFEPYVRAALTAAKARAIATIYDNCDIIVAK